MRITYRSDQLIAECQSDIAEFGPDAQVAAWYIFANGQPLVRNYDFYEPDDPIRMSEMEDGESVTKTTLSKLLAMLEQQNKIL